MIEFPIVSIRGYSKIDVGFDDNNVIHNYSVVPLELCLSYNTADVL
jgi:hypothetical protein